MPKKKRPGDAKQFRKGDLVHMYGDPAEGRVHSVASDGSWVQVRWYHEGMEWTMRMEPSVLENITLLNGTHDWDSDYNIVHPA